jgi:hypothetical protein
LVSAICVFTFHNAVKNIDALAIKSILENGFKSQKTSDTLIFQIHTKLTVGGAGLSGIAPTASASVTHLDQTQIDTGHSCQVKSICLNKLPIQRLTDFLNKDWWQHVQIWHCIKKCKTQSY